MGLVTILLPVHNVISCCLLLSLQSIIAYILYYNILSFPAQFSRNSISSLAPAIHLPLLPVHNVISCCLLLSIQSIAYILYYNILSFPAQFSRNSISSLAPSHSSSFVVCSVQVVFSHHLLSILKPLFLYLLYSCTHCTTIIVRSSFDLLTKGFIFWSLSCEQGFPSLPYH